MGRYTIRSLDFFLTSLLSLETGAGTGATGTISEEVCFFPPIVLAKANNGTL